ncbi:MAG: ABC transporter permease [Oscillospiraceae bacterium]|jgi:ABC-2 type transport system permease protein|nr:ABC transporter permease [Oscillospiraceae bacterium]
MKPYIALFRMRMIAGMQYRAAAWAGAATQFFWGLIFIMIYSAFYRSSAVEPPMRWNQLATYIWLQQMFLFIVMIWAQDNELLRHVTDGNVAYELCRPYDLFKIWCARLLAFRLSSSFLRFLPILIIAFLLPAQYKMSPPVSLGAAGLFLISLSLGLLIVTAVSMFIYILTIITLSPVGSRLIISVAADFLMGAVIPIPLMPASLQRVLDWFPFRYISDLPFRIYSGSIAGGDALFQMGVQVAWIIGLFMLGRLSFNKVMRRVVIQGG